MKRPQRLAGHCVGSNNRLEAGGEMQDAATMSGVTFQLSSDAVRNSLTSSARRLRLDVGAVNLGKRRIVRGRSVSAPVTPFAVSRKPGERPRPERRCSRSRSFQRVRAAASGWSPTLIRFREG